MLIIAYFNVYQESYNKFVFNMFVIAFEIIFLISVAKYLLVYQIQL